jgi:hypothetical protein
MCDLLDDEFQEVQSAALANLFEFLQQFSVDEMHKSSLIPTIKKLFHKTSTHFNRKLAEESTKIMFVTNASNMLIDTVLLFYREQVSLQQQYNSDDESLVFEDDIPEKSFLEMLLQGEIDFDRDAEIDK